MIRFGRAIGGTANCPEKQAETTTTVGAVPQPTSSARSSSAGMKPVRVTAR